MIGVREGGMRERERGGGEGADRQTDRQRMYGCFCVPVHASVSISACAPRAPLHAQTVPHACSHILSRKMSVTLRAYRMHCYDSPHCADLTSQKHRGMRGPRVSLPTGIP